MKSVTSSKNSEYLRIGYISDIHLGHPTTPTHHIIKNLRHAYPDNEETGRYDMIVIAGDVFDNALMLTDTRSIEIKVWIYWFLKIAAKRNIAIRVLKGTPSHDWDQSKYFEVINTHANLGVDLKYVDTLSIEKNERFGISILYVPDECRTDTDTIYADTCVLLKEHGMAKVDLAVMHGMFDFQLPDIQHLDKHRSDRWEAIVVYTIVCGHVHAPNSYGKIKVPGSFDRIAQGEEHPKGYMAINYLYGGDKFKEIQLERMTNDNAMIYKTLDCRDMSLEAAYGVIEDAVATIPKGHWLRIGSNLDDPITPLIGEISKRYSDHQWSPAKIYDKPKAKKTDKPLVIQRQVKVVRIDKENIETLVKEKMTALAIGEDKQPWVLKCLEEISV